MAILDFLAANVARLLAFAVAFGLCALIANWRIYRIAATIVVLGLLWQFATLFQFVPPQITNLVLVAALGPAWIGAAGGLLVRAYQLQQPGMSFSTRVITAAIGFVAFAVLTYFLGQPPP